MTDTYAASRLLMWAEFILAKESGEINGYPSQSNYTKLVQIRGGSNYNPNFDTDALDIDAFMSRLRKDDKLLHDMTSMCYGVKWTESENGIRKAKYTALSTMTAVSGIFGISASTVHARLSKVHKMVIDFLHDA